MSDFETALQSRPELAALAGGNRLSPRVSVSHPPPIPPPARPLLLLWEEEPPEKGASLRARACQWQPRVLEEVGSFPEYFSCAAPPLESAAAVYSCGPSRAGGVGAAVKIERGGFFLPWGGGGNGVVCFFFFSPSVAIS